jgi:Txe/YoeB family toxin of Txe-Axe toxin-antitoxin module
MECKVNFIDLELKKAFEDLEKSDPRLFKEVNKAIQDICQNSFCGRNVKKKLIPRELVQKHGIDNLWIYNLRKDWRLLYSVGRDEIELIAVILDWMDHKDYEKLFKF